MNTTLTKDKVEIISGSEAVIQSLLKEGVDTIFGYPGGAIMPIYDALYHYMDKIKHILTRHEQGAIHAAQGYARTSGKVGVCFCTSGPGATNFITGLADAMIDSTPLVCISGQVSSGLLGTDAFQEADVISMTMPVTKWNCQVTRPEDIPGVLAKAFYIARTGRPGPVMIDITKDAQFSKAEFQYEKCKSLRSYRPHPVLDKEILKEVAALIAQAKKPFLLIGQGILLSRAEKELLAFVDKSGIPVASTLLGLGALPSDHPQYMGFLGMHGNYAPNMKTNECDLLLAVGMRFDDRVTGDVSRYAKQAKVVHIDIDKAELNKIIKADVAVHADAKEAFAALIELVSEKKYPEWMEEFNECAEKEYQEVIKNDVELKGDKLKMAQVVKLLSEKTNGEAIVVTDVGQHQMIASRYYGFQKSNSNITSGGLGTMGFGLPAAMGAKMGAPSRTVIAIVGDGGFQMTLQELGTIMQSEIDVKVMILNNNFLGMVRQWQQLFFDKRYSFTEMTNPEFTTLAKAYNIPSEKVSDIHKIDEALDRMLNSKGAYLLEVVVDKEDNVFPMVPQGASVSEIRLK